MAAQRGKDLLLKIGNGAASETFTTVAGLRSSALAFNAETVDVTDADSAGEWRELLSGAGIRSATITGSGIFKDSAADAAVRTAFFAQSLDNWQIVIPDFGTVAGPFKLTSLQYEGAYDGELKVSLSLASAGELTFTAA